MKTINNLDFIGKIENIKSDIEFIFKQINLHDLTLPQMNQSNRGNYIQYYDQYTIDLVSDYYSTDINLFNYSFDDGKCTFYMQTDKWTC